jgi:hypothetical protein
MRAWIAVPLLLGLLAAPAAAATRRVAIVVGNDLGGPGRVTLRFAEADAGRFASVLAELGGFDRDDVHLLQGQRREAVEARLSRVAATTSAWRKGESDQVVLLFYYSGHSDGESLELGPDRLPFAHLRRLLQQAGADLRLLVIDSCRSGAFATAKSAVSGPAFDIRMVDDLATTGEATLTSSAAHELALESRELRGSFFSHYLISGLRGAADASGDGRITLVEAYRFAFTQTLTATSGTVAGPQHPTYDYRLSGRGELVLTDIRKRVAALHLPAGYQRILVTDADRGHLLAESTDQSARIIALPAGRYRLLSERDGRTVLATVRLAAGDERALGPDDFEPSGAGPVGLAVKGADAAAVAEARVAAAGVRRSSIGVLFGVAGAIADRIEWPLALQLAMRQAAGPGWRGSLRLSSGQADGVRETTAGASIGAGLGVDGRLLAQTGLELGAGATVQTGPGGRGGWTPFAAAVTSLAGGLRLTGDLSFVTELSVSVQLLRRDDIVALAWVPLVSAGLFWKLP